MDPRIAAISLVSGWVPITVDTLALLLFALALAALLGRRPRRRGGMRAAIAIVAGAGFGLLLCWLLSDALNLFEVSLSPISRAWVATAFAGVGIAIAVLTRRGLLRRRDLSRGMRRRAALERSISIVLVPAALLVGTLGVNADFGQYTTVGSLSGRAVAARLPASILDQQSADAPGADSTSAADAPATALWSHPAFPGSPSRGVVRTVVIPSTVSGFPARAAYLYLPPAALVAHPVALPVLIMLAGQPGGPSMMITAGRLGQIVDDFAVAHHGIAPIVVVPDQLSAPQVNPMCVDSAIGNSATYLTVDVPNWIRAHLTVQTSPAAWAIGGFSQGGTCSIQLVSAHPELFGGIFDISGQVAPVNGSLAQTIARGFGGSAAAYRAALPLTVLAAGAPYRDTVAVFVSGQFDSKYGPESDTVFAAAKAAGMRASRAVSPGTAHDWHTVQWALSTQLAPIYRQLGVLGPAS